MNRTTVPALISVCAAILLLLQGISLLRTRPNAAPPTSVPSQPPSSRARTRWFGIITILVACQGLISLWLVATGRLVLSPEFAVILVQGTAARVSLAILLIMFAVSTGLGVHVARSAARWPHRLLLLILIAVVVGILSFIRIIRLNPNTVTLLHIFSYDLWWPFMPVWAGICLLESVFAVLRVRHPLIRVWSITVLVWILGALAFIHWGGTYGQGVTTGTAIDDSSLNVYVWTLVMATTLLLCIGYTVWWLISSVTRYMRARSSPTVPLTQPVTQAWKLLNQLKLRQKILFLLLLAIAASLASLLYVPMIGATVALAIFFVAWLVLSEVIADGLMHDLYLRRQSFWAAQSPLRRGVASAGNGMRWGSGAAGRGLRSLVSIPSTPIAIVKLLLVMALLIILSESLNAGKTIIQPFRVSGAPQQAHLGPALSDHVINDLGTVMQQMRPDIIVPVSSAPGGPNVKYIPAGASNGLDTALAENASVTIGGVQLPTSLLIGPLQSPVRWLMNVRLINGSVQVNGTNSTLLASSSHGETWTVTVPLTVTKEIDLEQAKANNETELVPYQTLTLTDTISSMGPQLAFEIIRNDPKLTAPGMTQSWAAFKAFQNGLNEIKLFETGEYDALSAAINHFREATHRDPAFALAYYRLGLALQSDEQPGAATVAFRSAIQANPNFVAGYNALAFHLYDFDTYYFSLPAIGELPPSATAQQRRERLTEARRLWQQVIGKPTLLASRSDQASAYHGLCLDALSAGDQEANDRFYTSAYFYCQRAIRLYATLPSNLRTSPYIQQAEGYLQNLVGIALERSQLTTELHDTQDWNCDSNTFLPQTFDDDGNPIAEHYERGDNGVITITQRSLLQTPYSRMAASYYRRAQALLPDDTTIECNLANSASVTGDPQPMRTLEQRAIVHFKLGSEYAYQGRRSRGKTAQIYYRLALDEYQKAIDLQPNYLEALNNYAYTFWLWRLWHPLAPPPEGADAVIAERAEAYARKAVRLTQDTRDDVTRAIYTASLGEVLLGLGRPLEAIEVLRPLFEEAMVPDHPGFNEIRWDLAQAYICAGEFDDDGDNVAQNKQQAVRLLQQIEANERGREWQPFSDYPTALDPINPFLTCSTGPEKAVYRQTAAAGMQYMGAGDPIYQANVPCEWAGVAVKVSGPNGVAVTDTMILHVWGGGVEQRILFSDGVSDIVRLTSTPRDTLHYYFAQLEDPQGLVISPAYPIQTFKNCDKNLIGLVFKRE
ncbi:MAG TPA: hypothetical protein VGD58_27970 [Herpetosiphonaceae bacterium]